MTEAIGTNVGDISTGSQTRSHKKRDSVALMNHILNTCDLESYADAQGKLEWDKVMFHEMDSLEKNHTWI